MATGQCNGLVCGWQGGKPPPDAAGGATPVLPLLGLQQVLLGRLALLLQLPWHARPALVARGEWVERAPLKTIKNVSFTAPLPAGSKQDPTQADFLFFSTPLAV